MAERKSRKPVTRERCLNYLKAFKAALDVQGEYFNQAAFIVGMGMGQHIMQAMREAQIVATIKNSQGRRIQIMDTTRTIEEQATALWVAYKVASQRHNRSGKVHAVVEKDIDKKNQEFFRKQLAEKQVGITDILGTSSEKNIAEEVPSFEETDDAIIDGARCSDDRIEKLEKRLTELENKVLSRLDDIMHRLRTMRL